MLKPRIRLSLVYLFEKAPKVKYSCKLDGWPTAVGFGPTPELAYLHWRRLMERGDQ